MKLKPTIPIALPAVVTSLAFKKENLIKILVSSLEIPFTSPTRNGLPSPRFKSWWSDIRKRFRNFEECGAQQVDVPPIFQGDLTLKLLPKAKPSSTKRKKNAKTPSIKKPKVTSFVLEAQPKARVTSSTLEVYAENPQEKEYLTGATSKEQEGERTLIESDPLLSLDFLNLRAICSLLLSKHLETMRDTSKRTLSLKGFLLQQIGSIISQLQSKDKKDCLALPLDNFLSTPSEVESVSVNVG
nr:hypothetical protein CFP56_45898 [Quercus suber]